MHMLIFACIAVTALACGTGYGDLSKKATITFVISPPVEWTFGEGDASMGQAYSQSTAASKMKSDIQTAVRQSLPSSVSSSSITVTPNYTPIKALLNISCTAHRNSVEADKTKPQIIVVDYAYAVSRGTVFQHCKSVETAGVKAKDEVAKTSGSVKLTSTTAFYESQWENIMVLVQDKLGYKNVEFISDPVLSLN